jgi:bifunctional DNase/RNase
MLVPAEVWTLAKTDQGNAVLIKPKGADIAVPIFIGQAEAQSILIGLGEVEIQRPLTHDLLITTLKEINTFVRRVEITDLSEGIFYGRLVITKSGKEISVDARPSDCIAIAVRVKCNIYIDESIVDEAGISITIINNEAGATGENPIEMSKSDTELSKLKKQLDAAIEEENYEEAAKLRDKIKELEGKS